MKRALAASTAFFLALFSLGFVLGTIRVVLIAPRIGPLAATLAEVPAMLFAAVHICRWALRRWQVPDRRFLRCAMVMWFLLLLITCEGLLGALIFGRSVADQLAALATPAGAIGLAAQMLAAALPLFVRRHEHP